MFDLVQMLSTVQSDAEEQAQAESGQPQPGQPSTLEQLREGGFSVKAGAYRTSHSIPQNGCI